MLSLENIDDPARDAAWDRSLLKALARELRETAIERDWCSTYEDRLQDTVDHWKTAWSPGGPEQDWASRFLNEAARGLRVNVVATAKITVEHPNGIYMTGEISREAVYRLNHYQAGADLTEVTLDDLFYGGRFESGNDIRDFVDSVDSISAGDLSYDVELSLFVNEAD